MSKSKTKPQWMRPQDVQTFFTSDVKEMHGKYLPKNVLKTWTEDFVDEDTGELVSIERSQVLIGRGEITRDKLQEIAFHIQSGDIKEVEVCEQDIQEMTLFTPAYMTNYMVEPTLKSGSFT